MAEPIVSEDSANPLDQLSPLERPRAVLQWLQQGHQRFLEGHSLHPHSPRERMRAVVEGQHPLAAVLGCADSRVPVELLFTDRLRAGQLKVVAGYYDLHSSAIDWMGQVEPIRYPGPS